MKIYKRKDLSLPTFFQRLFKKQPKENALIEINNLLAENQENIKGISLDNVIEILVKYNTQMTEQDHQLRLDLLEDYLKSCLTDKKIENQEIEVLEHLKNLLFLNDKDFDNLITKETEKIYLPQGLK